MYLDCGTFNEGIEVGMNVPNCLPWTLEEHVTGCPLVSHLLVKHHLLVG